MTRPNLNPVPLTDYSPFPRGGEAYITMSPGQWDSVLQTAYDGGWVLLEVDGRERVRAAFKKL